MLLLPMDFWRAWRIQESTFLHQHSTLVKTELLLKKQTNKQNHRTTNTKKAKKTTLFVLHIHIKFYKQAEGTIQVTDFIN